jgi:uncharacterized protein YecT (DUF1311 family)
MIRMKRWIAPILLLLCLPYIAFAEKVDKRQSELEAALDAAMTQTDMNIASAELATYLEEKLDDLENRIRATSSGEELELFNRTAIRWREYRDAHVALVGKRCEGGSICPLMHNTARARLAGERIGMLRDMDLLGR